MRSQRDDPSPSPSQSPSPKRSPSPSGRRSRSRSRSRENSGNVKRITEMTTGDINNITSLYKVNVDCGPDQSNYTLSDGWKVNIEKVKFKSSDSKNIVDTLQRILNHDLGPQPQMGMSPDVCIYYVKNATSPVDAGDMMNAYSEKFTNYKAKESGYQVRKYINHLSLPSLSKRSNLKTTSGGTRHQRKSRRGKGKGKGKGKGNGRGKKSRSSKTLRRGRR
jgi:hypothetical protein